MSEPITPNQEPNKYSDEYIKELREENKKWRIEKSNLENELNEFKKLQQSEKEKELQEQNKFKELAEAKEKTLNEKVVEMENLKKQIEELSETKKQYDDFQKSVREELLSKLDENHKAIANDLTIDKLKTYVELNSKGHNYDKSRSGGLSFNTDGKKWEDFTSKELQEIEKVNPELLRKLFEMRNKK